MALDLKVEDASPLISYGPDGAWADSPSGDALVASYSGRSLHTTSAQGATATINFNGTGISIIGGHRSNYGTFTVSVDGQTITDGNAKSDQGSLIRTLGSVSNLANGPHTAVLTNTGGGAIDIDFVNVETQPSFSSSKTTSTVIDDNNTMIQYFPSPSAWNLNENQEYMDRTLHFTSTPGASASISFAGDAVAVYGTMAPDHADVQFTLDGRSSSHTGGAGGFVSFLHAQVLLYYANNLGPNIHILSMNSIGQGGGPFMDIDAIIIYSSVTSSSIDSGPTTPDNGPTARTSPASPMQPPRSAPSKQSFGPRIGGVVGGAVVLLLLGLFLFLLRRRRSHTMINKHDISGPTSPKTPDLPMQGASMMEAGLARGIVQSLRGTESLKDPAFTFLPPPPPSAQSIVKRETMHSIAPSYYSDPAYASEMSSPQSSTGLLPPLPTSLSSVLLLGSPTYPSSRGTDPVTMGNGKPRRPDRRPPPLDTQPM